VDLSAAPDDLGDVGKEVVRPGGRGVGCLQRGKKWSFQATPPQICVSQSCREGKA